MHNAPSASDARASLVPTFVSQLVSHMDQQMPRNHYKAEERSNTDCMTCIGRLIEMLAEPNLDITDDDVEYLTPLILSHMRLHRHLPPGSVLVVS